MNCPTCGARISAQAEICPNCLDVLAPKAGAKSSPTSEPPPPPTPEPALRGQTDVGAPYRSEARGAEDVPRCEWHPERPSVARCPRCHSRYCERCVPDASWKKKKAPCPGCVAPEVFRDAPGRIRDMFRELGTSLLLFGVALPVVGFAIGLVGSPMGALAAATGLGCLATPLLVGCGLALMWSRSPWLFYVGFVLELSGSLFLALGSVTLFLALSGALRYLSLLFLLVPLVTGLRIWSLKQQRAILRRGPAFLPVSTSGAR